MVRNQRDETLVMPNNAEEIFFGTDAGGDCIAVNGTETVTISNVAPAGVGTATIDSWLVININGTNKYIPMWT